MILPNRPDQPDPPNDEDRPLDELDTHPGDPSRPPLKGYWLGGRKPTPEEAQRAFEELDRLREEIREETGPIDLEELLRESKPR